MHDQKHIEEAEELFSKHIEEAVESFKNQGGETKVERE